MNEGQEGLVEPEEQVPLVPGTKSNIPTKKPLMLAILVVMIVLITGGAVYGGMKLQEKKNSPTPSAKITPSQNVPTAIPTTDPTAGWKTYVNTKCQLSFKYPQTYSISEEKSSYFELSSPDVKVVNRGKVYGENDLLLRFNCEIDLKGKTVSELVDADTEDCGCEILKRENVIISGKDAIHLALKDPGATPYEIYYFNTDKFVEFIKAPITTSRQNEFDQILSTFKFLDSNQIDATAGWKTYINNKYNYFIKYPSDYSFLEQGQDYVRFFKGNYDPNLPQPETYFSIAPDEDYSNPEQRCPNGIVSDLPQHKGYCKISPSGKIILLTEILMEPDQSTKVIFDQILSTFKFIQ